jgi:hypothetical protein
MHRNINFSILAVAAAVGLIALLIGLNTMGSNSTALPAESEWPEAAGAPPAYQQVSGSQVGDQIKLAISDSALKSSLDRTDREQLAGTVASAMDAYWHGDVDAYRTLLESQGLQLHADFLANEELFRSRTSSVRGAQIDLDHVAVESRMRGGQAVEVQTPLDRAMTAISLKSSRGLDDVIDPVSIGTDVVAVTIPAHMRDLRGASFEGEFRLLLARRPSDGAWLVIALEIERPSTSGPVGMPPL